MIKTQFVIGSIFLLTGCLDNSAAIGLASGMMGRQPPNTQRAEVPNLLDDYYARQAQAADRAILRRERIRHTCRTDPTFGLC